MLHRALSELPNDMRELLLLRDFAEVSWEEIARAVNAPSAEAARMRHTRARALLGRHIAQSQHSIAQRDNATAWLWSPDLYTGAILGSWRVGTIVHSSAHGAVFAGASVKNGSVCAIKAVHRTLPEHVSFRAGVAREVQLAPLLRHGSVVPIIDSGTTDDLLYYVMPFYKNGSLRVHIEELNRVPNKLTLAIPVDPRESPAELRERQARVWVRQIALALSHVHGSGVLHGDVKPGNILLDDDHNALLADFGFARYLASPVDLAQAGLRGTPNYMSPEQASPGTAVIGVQSDLFSLGVVAYELISGVQLFVGTTERDVLETVCRSTPERLESVMPGISKEFADVVSALLSKHPQDRPSTAAEVASKLVIR